MCAQVSLGYYEREVDAARAYDAESLRLRGPNGHINLPESRAMIDARPHETDISRANSAGPPSHDTFFVDCTSRPYMHIGPVAFSACL